MSPIKMLDRRAQDLSLNVAKRRTRRGFLGRTGKAAVAVTGVALVEDSFVASAEAHHTCGHTGTTPTCGNNVCVSSRVQGGCWYACCSACGSGRIRKICDCCVPGSTTGYCPGGYRVHCITYRCQSNASC